MIKPIATWGAEIWFHPHSSQSDSKVELLQRLQYMCLKGITGATQSSRHENLGYIANIEMMEDKVEDMQL